MSLAPAVAALLWILTLVTNAGSSDWEKRILDNDLEASCCDGSPALYHYRPGAPGSRRWLVMLQGGYWCFDASSCVQRWKLANVTMSTVADPEHSRRMFEADVKEGIFDKPNTLAGAHAVYVQYCSGDAFMGDSSPPELHPGAETTGNVRERWHFRGKRIIVAVFQDLRVREGLGKHDGDLLVFGGFSAGGRGAMMALDYVAERLAGKAATVGLLDSPMWVPQEPLRGVTKLSLLQETRTFAQHANALNHLMRSNACENAFADSKYKCMFPSYRLPFVKTPVILIASQFDQFQLEHNCFGRGSQPWDERTVAERKCAEQFQMLTREYLQRATRGRNVLVFAPAWYHHVFTASILFSKLTIDNSSIATALSKFIDTSPPGDSASISLMQSCTSFDCGQRAFAKQQLLERLRSNANMSLQMNARLRRLDAVDETSFSERSLLV